MNDKPAGFDISKILNQIQGVRQKITEAQSEMRSRTVEASVGGGMVTATANGAQEIVSINIDSELISGGDVEMLQDLIIAAVNEALRKSKDLMADELSKYTGGLNIRDLF